LLDHPIGIDGTGRLGKGAEPGPLHDVVLLGSVSDGQGGNTHPHREDDIVITGRNNGIDTCHPLQELGKVGLTVVHDCRSVELRAVRAEVGDDLVNHHTVGNVAREEADRSALVDEPTCEAFHLRHIILVELEGCDALVVATAVVHDAQADRARSVRRPRRDRVPVREVRANAVGGYVDTQGPHGVAGWDVPVRPVLRQSSGRRRQHPPAQAVTDDTGADADAM
jgi:hypothetical protein